MCDSRLVSKRYGRSFINSLPSHNCQVLGADSVGRYIQMWRRSHER